MGSFFLDGGESPAPPPGAWTWYSDPRAVRSGDKTFVAHITKDGKAQAWRYDHLTGLYSLTRTLHTALDVDDHANPALLIRASDSRLMAFYSAHNGAAHYLRISTNPLDTFAWGDEVNLDTSFGLLSYTYANPVQLTDEANDPIYVFFRGDPSAEAGWAQYYSVSADGGATWAAATNWLGDGTNRPYLKLVQNGGARIDFAMTDGHPNEVATNSIYHGYYEAGSFYKSDGTLVGDAGDFPLAASAFTKVYNGATVRAWIHDITIDGSGNPVLVYATFPTTSDHRYRYARWTGTEWVDAEICAAGGYLYAAEAYYSGGVVIDPTNVNVVIASRSVDAGLHQLWKYTTTDGGATWDAGTQLTTSETKCIRPVFVRGATTNPRLLYITGTYTTYENFDMTVVLRDI